MVQRHVLQPCALSACFLRDELYQLLDLDRRASAADIKRAYRNKSLQMHPDKLNQKGKEVTDEDRANFQKMKAAYDVSSLVKVVLQRVIPYLVARTDFANSRRHLVDCNVIIFPLRTYPAMAEAESSCREVSFLCVFGACFNMD